MQTNAPSASIDTPALCESTHSKKRIHSSRLYTGANEVVRVRDRFVISTFCTRSPAVLVVRVWAISHQNTTMSAVLSSRPTLPPHHVRCYSTIEPRRTADIVGGPPCGGQTEAICDGRTEAICDGRIEPICDGRTDRHDLVPVKTARFRNSSSLVRDTSTSLRRHPATASSSTDSRLSPSP